MNQDKPLALSLAEQLRARHSQLYGDEKPSLYTNAADELEMLHQEILRKTGIIEPTSFLQTWREFCRSAQNQCRAHRHQQTKEYE